MQKENRLYTTLHGGHIKSEEKVVQKVKKQVTLMENKVATQRDEYQAAERILK